MRSHLAVAVLSLVAGCSNKAEAPAKGEPAKGEPAKPASDAAVAAAAPTPVTAPVKTGSGSGAASGFVAMTAEQKASSKTFREQIALGRKATDAKHYADAITAFDAALEARHDEPHALAERGFAKLLQGTSLSDASADFDHAADATHDPKLLAMIWFNRGLTDDKLNNHAAALVDYYFANQLMPSKAAAAKLAGQKVCPLRFASAAELATHKPVEAATWLALATAMMVLDPDTDAAPVDEARARVVIAGDDKVSLPGVFATGSEHLGRTMALVWMRGKTLAELDVGESGGGRCPGEVSGKLVSQVGDLVHVRVSEAANTMDELCGDDHHDCSGSDGDERSGTACMWGSLTVRDIVIDLAKDAPVILGEQSVPIPGDIPPTETDPRFVPAKLAADGLHVSGLGCDQVVPVASGGAK